MGLLGRKLSSFKLEASHRGWPKQNNNSMAEPTSETSLARSTCIVTMELLSREQGLFGLNGCLYSQAAWTGHHGPRQGVVSYSSLHRYPSPKMEPGGLPISTG